MNKYYGYVYIWRDAKRNMYCVGSHYGTVEDSYITSTGWMKAAYKKRPQDFKMKVLEYLFIDDKKTLLNIEQKFLNMIKEEELGKQYYNIKKHAIGGGRRIGQKNKKYHKAGGWNRGLNKEMMELRKSGFFCLISDKPKIKRSRSGWNHTKEAKKKMSESSKGKIAWNKGKSMSNEQKQKLSKMLKGRVAWNKGKICPESALNGKKGAKKMAAVAKGRKRYYKEDGTWTWVYNINGKWGLTPPTINV